MLRIGIVSFRYECKIGILKPVGHQCLSAFSGGLQCSNREDSITEEQRNSVVVKIQVQSI